MSEILSETPLARWHITAGATMAPFAGYEMPIHYGSIVDEHHACRSRGVLFDVSHMGRLRFDGEGSAELLDRLLTRRVTDLPVGGVRYGLVCNADGMVLDDVLVSHLETPSGARYHLMVVNASNRDKIVRWITPQVADFPKVTMSDRTELTAMIAVQGPAVMEAVARLFRSDPRKLKYYRASVTDQMGKPVIVSRTGYTGEDGVELIVRAEEANRVWENLLLAGRDCRFVPAGLGARDTLRLEAGMPLYGHELDEQTDPLSAGLGFACNLDDRSFNGDTTLRAIRDSGPSAVRVGLRPEGRRPAREGCAVFAEGQDPSLGGEPIGRVTSGTVSPTLGYPIAMGYVAAAHAEIGTRLAIDIRGKSQPAVVAPLPFYRRPDR